MHFRYTVTGSHCCIPPSVACTGAESMYTFGAPAVSRPAMPDLNQADHCFRGLRTYTATWTKAMGKAWENYGGKP